MDDILVSGRTLEEHDRNVRAVLSQLQEIGVKLSPGKSKLRLTSVKYFGHKITDEGLQPDPAKVRPIQDMPQPQDVTELLRFLGMVKYLAKFIPNLSDLAAPLNELLKKRGSGYGKHNKLLPSGKSRPPLARQPPLPTLTSTNLSY